MASNEAWQEFDAAATVELNTRDPLLCGPADIALVIDLIRALIGDGEGLSQCLILTATSAPILAEEKSGWNGRKRSRDSEAAVVRGQGVAFGRYKNVSLP